MRSLRVAGALAVTAMLIGCGRAPVGTGDIAPSPSPSSVAASPAPSPSPSPLPTPPPWPMYSDGVYKFAVSYPPGFAFVQQHGDPAKGLLQTYRVVDPIYLNTYPPGQIEISIYKQDAASPTDWVAKHSAPPGTTDISRYWSPVTNEANLTVSGKAAVTFDWVPDTWATTVHSIAVFIGSSYVLVLQWWSKDANYDVTLQSDFNQMESDLRG